MKQPPEKPTGKDPKKGRLPSTPTTSPLLGNYEFKTVSFENLDGIFDQFKGDGFRRLKARQRFSRVNRTLLNLILEAPRESFLLPALIAYIDKVNQERVLDEPYRFLNFEFWLNHFSQLSPEDCFLVRGKIIGKLIPRHDYQAFFPIGMNRVFAGSHFVTAHISPDADTTIASFWGWADAFAAKLCQGMHIWSLPGGAPDSHVTMIFKQMFGPAIFTFLAKDSGTLTLSSIDLIKQTGMVKKHPHTITSTIDHRMEGEAIVLVDQEGHFLGDWRPTDGEGAHQVAMQFLACLRWFENRLLIQLISLFAKQQLQADEIQPLISSVFDTAIKECEPIRELTENQRRLQRHVHDFLGKVLGMDIGLKGTFADLALALKELSLPEFSNLKTYLESLSQSDLFNSNGTLKENRPKTFEHLQKVIGGLAESFQSVRNYVDRLHVMMSIKSKVLGRPPVFVTLRSDVDEIRTKMKNYDYLTVVIPEDEGKWFPVGIIRATDLSRPSLGTVSLRDFCNTEEIKMASYLEVISVVDHHKAALKTNSTPMAIVGDAQSSNVLVAEQTFSINDRYSRGGLDSKLIEKAIESIGHEPVTTATTRVLLRLLNRRIADKKSGEDYFVHPQREFSEYLCFLYAIIDDTDLLSKVSNRDVDCVAQLLNRLKSLSLLQEVEIINFDDIPKDDHFAKAAAKRILQNEDMYSLYQKIYEFKDLEVETNLELCAKGRVSNIFIDTKEQNGCARVGQTKTFSNNVETFQKYASKLRESWLGEAQKVNAAQPEIDLHIHMISTITGAQEVYTGTAGNYTHQDEMWFWTPQTEQALDHLVSFLNAFQTAPEVVNNFMQVEFLGSNARELAQVFSRHFKKIPHQTASVGETDLPIAVLRYQAGSINSRKSMISPYVPRLIS